MNKINFHLICFLNLAVTNDLGPRSNKSIFENTKVIYKTIHKNIWRFVSLVQKSKNIEMPILGIIKWVEYFHVFIALLGAMLI